MIRLSKNFANNTLFLRSDILDFLSNIVQQVITVIYSFLQGIGLVHRLIMIGIFYGIRDFQFEGSASFQWMQSISNPDPTYILPVLSALTTFIASKQTMPAGGGAQNKMMMYFMPLYRG